MADPRIIETVKKYLRTIPSEWGVKKAYLFGSYAKGKEREESDIDLALIVSPMPDFFSMQRQLRKLRRKIDLRIEPHPIKEQDFGPSNPFAHEIANTGIEINLN
jgi:predicted nucleotidyltransferase